MKKNKGKNGQKPHTPAKPAGVNFELEEDAEAIFVASLDNLKPDKQPMTEELMPLKSKAQKPKGPVSLNIDLHGKTLSEAMATLDHAFERALDETGVTYEVTVITGKGIHSGREGGVLFKEIHTYVVNQFGRYILKIDTSPADVLVQGLPIRGHFKLLLKS
jgi:DNA-nicking Smr family endonuclease